MKWLDQSAMSGPTSGSTMSSTSSESRKSSSSASRKCGVSSSSESLSPFSARWTLKISSSRASLSAGNSWVPGRRYPLVRKNSTCCSLSTAVTSFLVGRSRFGADPGCWSRGGPVSGAGVHRVDELDEELHVLHVVLRCRLGDAAGGHDLMEVLQLVGVGILEVRAENRALVGVPNGAVGDERRREVPDVRRVVLHPQRPGLAVHLDVGVETRLVVDTGLVGHHE